MVDISFESIDGLEKELNHLERMSKSEFNRLRNKKFRECILRQYRTDPNLQRLYHTNGIFEADLPRTLDEIKKLPFVDKKMVKDARYDQNLIVPRSQIVKVLHTYGSLSEPTRIPYSIKSTKRLMADFFVRSMIFSETDPYKTCYSISMFLPNKDVWASHFGMKSSKEYYMKDKMIDESSITPLPVHLENIKKIKPHSVMTAVAALIPLSALSDGSVQIPRLFSAGQYFSEETREYLEKSFSSIMLGFYATTEGGVIASECPQKEGYHIWTDEFEFEILDENNERVSEGERGRVVVTSFSTDAVSLIRYTGITDEVTYVGECSCGSKFPIIKEIKRFGYAPLGNLKFPYWYIEEMGTMLRQKGIPTSTPQLTYRREKDGKITPIIRLELRRPVSGVEEEAKRLFFLDEQAVLFYESGWIHEPEVELYKMGELSKGEFKAKYFVAPDEE